MVLPLLNMPPKSAGGVFFLGTDTTQPLIVDAMLRLLNRRKRGSAFPCFRAAEHRRVRPG